MRRNLTNFHPSLNISHGKIQFLLTICQMKFLVRKEPLFFYHGEKLELFPIELSLCVQNVVWRFRFVEESG